MASRREETRVTGTTTRVEVTSDRGVFMISVAAELAAMHPQTLRMYEARGLIEPKRSPKGTRLYSHEDVDRLRRIQEMTAELGMNLAGVERVFELEEKLDAMARKVAVLERRAGELKSEVERLEAIRRELRAEIVPYERGGELIRAADLKTFRIPIERSNRHGVASCATICRVLTRLWGERERTTSAYRGRGACCVIPIIAFVLLVAPISTATAAPVAHATAVGPAPSSQPLQLVLPLVAHDAGLAQLAQAVSTPGSPEYAHYESIQQLARRFGASAATRARVVRYLRAAGASEREN